MSRLPLLVGKLTKASENYAASEGIRLRRPFRRKLQLVAIIIGIVVAILLAIWLAHHP